jgi:hypothetical protein
MRKCAGVDGLASADVDPISSVGRVARMPHKDPEKRREGIRKWPAANPEKIREANLKWRTANPDKARQASRAYREANLEEVRARQRQYQAAKRARAKKRGGGGTPAPRRQSECDPRHGEPFRALPLVRGGVPTPGRRGGGSGQQGYVAGASVPSTVLSRSCHKKLVTIFRRPPAS